MNKSGLLGALFFVSFWLLAGFASVSLQSCAHDDFEIEPGSIPTAQLNVPYKADFYITDSHKDAYRWRLSPGSQLPAGLSFQFDNRRAVLQGTPTEAGEFYFMLAVSSDKGHSNAEEYILKVDGGLTILTDRLHDASVQSGYSATLAAAGGTGAGYSWVVESGNLPPGITLVSGSPDATLLGTPTTEGIYQFALRVTDSDSNTDVRSLSLVVAGSLSISVSVPVVEPVIGQYYALTLTANGGTGSMMWRLSQGALPVGLSLVPVTANTAVIQGTPSVAGNFAFTVQVEDSLSNTGVLAFNWLVGNGLSITTTSVPNGAVSSSYFAAVRATTGAGGPHNWIVTVGSLPPGVNLSWSSYQPTASLSGVPTTPGTYGFTLEVRDSGTGVASLSFQIGITTGPVQILTSALAFGAPGVPYVTALEGTGGSGSGYQWDLFGGALPPGLTITPNGTPFSSIVGTPAASGVYNFTLRLTDSATNAIVANLTLEVYGQGRTYAIAGTGTSGYNGDGKPALGAELGSPNGVATDSQGNIFIADTSNHRIRRIDATTGKMSTICGTGAVGNAGDGGPASNAKLNYPRALWVDAANNIYIADSSNHVIRRITASNNHIDRIAGNYSAGFSGDSGLAISAQLNNPQGICLAPNGDMYIADHENFRIRKVAAGTGVISTFAGSGSSTHSGDGGLAINAGFNYVSSVGVDNAGNVIIGEFYYYIRRVDTSGVITTIAGVAGGGTGGYGGPAELARMSHVDSVHIDPSGHIYITANGRVLRINATTGFMDLISVHAGHGVGLWVDPYGHLLVADRTGSYIYRIISP
ncbi:putative Ig domain-containing protein [Planctomycetota bacterium]|nr:putative Ig domain-containing protein [Planctomycetota bacterium]